MLEEEDEEEEQESIERNITDVESVEDEDLNNIIHELMITN